jgi:hypothetical protein
VKELRQEHIDIDIDRVSIDCWDDQSDFRRCTLFPRNSITQSISIASRRPAQKHAR